MRIVVTKEDIRKGRPKDRVSCPIALALKRHGLNKPFVERWHCSFYKSKRSANLTEKKLPRRVQQFIFRFDIGEEVRPISFDL